MKLRVAKTLVPRAMLLEPKLIGATMRMLLLWFFTITVCACTHSDNNFVDYCSQAKQERFHQLLLESQLVKNFSKGQCQKAFDQLHDDVGIQLIDVGITNLQFLSDFRDTKALIVSRNNITSLEGLQGLEQLQKLDFSFNEVRSLEAIRGLANLRSLRFFKNEVSNLQPIASLTKMIRLSAPYNRIKSLNGIEKLSRLETLRIHGNEISSIEPILSLPNIKYLSVGMNRICDPKEKEKLKRHVPKVVGLDKQNC